MIKLTHQALRALLVFGVVILLGVSCSTKKETRRVLVFSKTAGYRHESIAAGIAAIKKMGDEKGFLVDTTEDAHQFNEENLRNYHAIIFLNTTGDVLNKQQQNDFERFIQAGGGYVGIHAATDTEYNWPWYNGLVGAYFLSHPNNPNVRTAEFYVTDHNHPATDSLPERFTRSDEFYNFKSIKTDLIKVLVKIDEKTYEGGENADDHPISWYHEYDGGRAFYTAMGHTDETYSEPLFLDHLWGGLQYVFDGTDNLNYKLAKSIRVPDENRFTKVVLDEFLDEPVELAVMNDNRVLFIERKGRVKLYDPAEGKTKVIYELTVSRRYKHKDGGREEAEDGLLGLALDPDFEKNNFVYLYYSEPSEDANILTRWEFKDNQLIESSRKVLLKVPVQREQCCHTGGSIDFDAQGNLYLSTGDNTSPRATRYAPIDQRPGRGPWDAQKGSANTNDLRGKILRIHPEPDGTYTIPEGNLFPKGMEKTKPEIYVMGTRNPYRIAVDKKTGYVYWGDVGPDGSADSIGRGPKGYDEFNQARKPGFYGWPLFIGNNQAYYEYDFATRISGDKFNPEKPINNSPNNTGLTELPPAQSAYIWYPYDASPEFPLVGSGGRTAMAGPVFYKEDFKGAKRAFPDYYDGKLFIYEWMRGWIMAVTMNEEGDLVEMEQFMPSHKFSNPMDMAFGPDGDLYMLEYGTGWFQQNDNARLVRIEYNGGNRKPDVRIAATKEKGATPMTVDFTSKGTQDPDRDELTYAWEIKEKDGATLTSAKGEAMSYTFDKPGIYTAILTVKDTHGEATSQQLEIQAGNEPASLSFSITKGNKSFFFPNKPFEYNVTVSDKEDGSLGNGINPEDVSVQIQHRSDDITLEQLGHQAAALIPPGKLLMDESDCKACHLINKASIGPMYTAVAKKYKDDPNAVPYLIDKVIKGGSGVWGDVAMSAHPQLADEEARQMIEYILSLGDESNNTLPASGSFASKENGGVLMMRAFYTDRGANGVPSVTSEQAMILKSARMSAGKATSMDGINKFRFGTPAVDLMIGTKDGAYIGFDPIDLTGVDRVTFDARAPIARLGSVGGKVEVRIDSPDGKIIGETPMITPDNGNSREPRKVVAPIQPVEGEHAVYFVYRNENANEKPLFILMSFEYGSR